MKLGSHCNPRAGVPGVLQGDGETFARRFFSDISWSCPGWRSGVRRAPKQIEFRGKQPPGKKGKGPSSDAKSHAPDRLGSRLPQSSPSQPAQQGRRETGSLRRVCSTHPDISEDPFFQQIPAGQSLQYTWVLALAWAPISRLPSLSSPQWLAAQGHSLFRKWPVSEVLAGEEGGKRPCPGPLGSGAAPRPRVELSRSAGKGLGPAYMWGQERATAGVLRRILGGGHCWPDAWDLPRDSEPRITGCPRFPGPNPRSQIFRTLQVRGRIFALHTRFPNGISGRTPDLQIPQEILDPRICCSRLPSSPGGPKPGARHLSAPVWRGRARGPEPWSAPAAAGRTRWPRR